MKRAAVLFVAILFALVLIGCVDPNAAPPPPTFRVTANTFCTVMRTLRTSWSVHDTNETIDDMRTIAHVKTCACARVKPKSCKKGAVS